MALIMQRRASPLLKFAILAILIIRSLSLASIHHRQTTAFMTTKSKAKTLQSVSPLVRRQFPKLAISVESLMVPCWIVSVTSFILINNSHGTCWPPILLQVPYKTWCLLHMLGSAIFSGGCFTTMVLEWAVVSSRNPSATRFWFQEATPRVERGLILPALTLSIVSGIAMSFLNYGSVRSAPPHVQYTLHALALFGVWWGWTDYATQKPTLQALQRATPKKQSPRAVRLRRLSHALSAGFLLLLYAVMILKPGG